MTNTRRDFVLFFVSTFAILQMCNMLAAQGNRTQSSITRVATARGTPIAKAPRAPFPPLNAAHQKYLDQVLGYWEHSSAQIKKYRCKFTRWQYDPVFGPRVDPKTGDIPAKTIATGVIQYAKPDKGMYEVTSHYDYTPPKEAGGKAQYLPRKENVFEKWICDGNSVFEFDFPRKVLIERQLPPEMRGKAIGDGPLPFMFGAEIEKVKRRYWLRVITPPNTVGEYWLEAWPKSRQDAANYKKVKVIIDEKDFLPKGIEIFATNYDAKKNPARTAFVFEERKVNFIGLKDLDKLQLFHNAFHRPKAPGKDWKKEVIKHGQPAQPQS